MKRLSFFVRRPLIACWLGLTALLLLVYGEALFSSREILLSDKNGDLAIGFWSLKFIFGELARGNFALWNPHLLSGFSVFASFQSMLLYPPAWIWAVLPLVKASNIFIVFHLWIFGAGMIWWMLRRGLHPVAAFVSGALLCLGSAGTMRVLPGHITPLAVIAWMPILLLIFDELLESRPRRSLLKWVLAGIAIIALQVAAGFPQHFFYCALAIGIYFLARLWERVCSLQNVKWRFVFSRLACACVMYGGGILLLSVQLLTSWHASKETSRAGALPFSFVASFSFPPENFLTLLAPGFFGGTGTIAYWGRGYIWELCLYIGVAGVLCALYGLLRVRFTRTFPLLLAAVLMLVLAMGKYTFLLKFLYLHVPIFGGFRASARALCQASVFLCALSGIGLDAIIGGERTASLWRERVLKLWPAIVFALGFLLAGIALWLPMNGAKTLWLQGLARIANSNESYVPDAAYSDPRAVASMIQNASGALLIAAITCLVVAILMRLITNAQSDDAPKTRARLFTFTLAALCVLEVAFFAFSTRQSFDLRALENPQLEKFFAAQNGNDRFLKSSFDNWAMKWNANDVAGYESFRLRRYDEFINWTQGRNPDLVRPILEIQRPHPLYAMLRCRYFLNVETMQKTEIANVLPHVLLVNDARVLPSRDAIFATMKAPTFDPRKTVLLESTPPILPDKNAPVGSARVLQSSTNEMTIEVQTKTPTILLITDSYSRDWVARGLPDENGERNSQAEYSVLPANWVLRAIPLQAGKHRILLEYRPRIFVIGKWISLASLLIFLAVSALAWWPQKSHAAVGE